MNTSLISNVFIVFLSEKAGVELDGGSYLIHKIYDDQETLSLVAAACETLGIFNLRTKTENCLFLPLDRPCNSNNKEIEVFKEVSRSKCFITVSTCRSQAKKMLFKVRSKYIIFNAGLFCIFRS